jgi:hypothetical protein
MFFGVNFFNDILKEAGTGGYVQTEILLQKNKETFTFGQGWAFPRRVLFNGDECMMPPPDSYPFLPSSSSAKDEPSLGVFTFYFVINFLYLFVL